VTILLWVPPFASPPYLDLVALPLIICPLSIEALFVYLSTRFVVEALHRNGESVAKLLELVASYLWAEEQRHVKLWQWELVG
jgi:hypothetical protein